MTTASAPQRDATTLLAPLARGVFAAGLWARLCMPEDLRPGSEALAVALTCFGAGLLLLDLARRGRAVLPLAALLLPLCLIPPAWTADAAGRKLATDLATAAAAAFGARALALARGRAAAFVVVAAPCAALALFGVAQTLYLNEAARAAALAVDHPLTATEQGRAFLASWRAPATLTSPNAFAGLLLLVGPAALAAAAARGRGALAVAGAVFCGAFLCAGSAGAAVALAAGGCLAALAWTTPRTAARSRAALAAALCAATALAGIVVAATTPDATGKLATLAERIDYHRAGFRLLADALPFGAGFGGVSARAAAAFRPGESFSRSLHDWWLEGLVEAGVWFVPLAAAFVVVARRALRGRVGAVEATAASPSPARPALRAEAVGAAAGAFVAGATHPFVAFAPPSWGVDPLVDAALLAALAYGLTRLLGAVLVEGRGVARGIALGFAAFLLHGLVDFDLAVAGVAAAFGVVLGIAARTDADTAPGAPVSPAARALTLLYALVAAFAAPFLALRTPA